MHCEFQINCSHCAPLFSSLYFAKTWVAQEAQPRGVTGIPLHYDCIIVRDAQLLFPVTVGNLSAWVRTPFANHQYQVSSVRCRLPSRM